MTKFMFDKELMRKYARVSGWLWGGALLLGALLMLLTRSRDFSDTTASPDGSVRATLAWNKADSCVGISIYVDDSLLMEADHLGFVADSHDYAAVTAVRCLGHDSCDRTDTLAWGENRVCRYHYRNSRYRLSSGDQTFLLDIQVSDDGVAWRYEHESGMKGRLLQGESSRYRFPTDGTCWSIPANFESYEFAYREQPISQTTDANTPFTFRLKNGLYGSLHEAQLTDVPEMTLVRKDGLDFGVWMAPSADSTIGYATRLTNDRVCSSWRVVTIGRKAVDLPNAHLVDKVCLSQSSAQNSSRAQCPKPIKYVGVWWGMHLGINSWTPDSRHGATTSEALRHIDFAAAHNIQGVLFEGWNLGWEQWGGTQEFDYTHAAPDFDVERVTAYAHERGVEIIMHHETGGNIPHYEQQMEEAFGWCRDHGIRYVKTGYAGGFPNREIHHSLYGVEHYNRVMRTAARYGICLDVHEPIKPTGLCTHCPNLMTGEGARGMEWNAWSDGNTPAHTCTLPFTRLLAGPMDYTPGIFDITYQSLRRHPHQKWNQKDAEECRVHTTLAKQAALWTVIYSPMVMAADLIENYEGHPMFGFFEDYDPDIEWSRYTDGEIGKFLVVVRKACNKKYYIGVITNQEARDVEVPLDFLPQGPFTATLYEDADDAHYQTNPTAYKIERQRADRSKTLHLHLAPGGGAAVVVESVKSNDN